MKLRLLEIALAVCFVPAVVADDALRRHHVIGVIHQGKVVTSVIVPAEAKLQVEADSVSHDNDGRTSTFRGQAVANVTIGAERVFSISASELRVAKAR